MIDLTKPEHDADLCHDCGLDIEHCDCHDDFLDDEDFFDDEDHDEGDYDDDDYESSFERSFKHLVTTAAGVALCVAGLLGSMGHIPMSGFLIFIGAMLLL